MEYLGLEKGCDNIQRDPINSRPLVSWVSDSKETAAGEKLKVRMHRAQCCAVPA
jgi:hypothetical protein